MGFRQRFRFRHNSYTSGGTGTGNLFNSGWEAATGTSTSALHDGGTWDDSGGANATVESSVTFAGNNALNVLMSSGNGTNGPDFRVDKAIATQSVLYLRWYERFSSNYYFAQHDHKMVIVGVPPIGQDVYIQLRGNAGNTTARMCVHVIDTGVNDGVDTQAVWECLSGTGSAIARDTWHRFEACVRMGAGGGVEYRVGGVTATMTAVKNTETLNNLTNGVANGAASLGYFKWDTTYNGYDEAGVQAATPFNLYVDNFAVGNSTWIGA